MLGWRIFQSSGWGSSGQQVSLLNFKTYARRDQWTLMIYMGWSMVIRCRGWPVLWGLFHKPWNKIRGTWTKIRTFSAHLTDFCWCRCRSTHMTKTENMYEKKLVVWVIKGIYGDYFINHDFGIPIKQPGWLMESQTGTPGFFDRGSCWDVWEKQELMNHPQKFRVSDMKDEFYCVFPNIFEV